MSGEILEGKVLRAVNGGYGLLQVCLLYTSDAADE